jgi:hypothetical protein
MMPPATEARRERRPTNPHTGAQIDRCRSLDRQGHPLRKGSRSEPLGAQEESFPDAFTASWTREICRDLSERLAFCGHPNNIDYLAAYFAPR